MAPEGKNILMLPATTNAGKNSSIVPELQSVPIVVPRGDVQYVVTEYGGLMGQRSTFGPTGRLRSDALAASARSRMLAFATSTSHLDHSDMRSLFQPDASKQPRTSRTRTSVARSP